MSITVQWRIYKKTTIIINKFNPPLFHVVLSLPPIRTFSSCPNSPCGPYGLYQWSLIQSNLSFYFFFFLFFSTLEIQIHSNPLLVRTHDGPNLSTSTCVKPDRRASLYMDSSSSAICNSPRGRLR